MKRAVLSSSSRRGSRGVALIEVLMAALIFSLGVLGLVGLSAVGVGVQSETRYRTDAASVTNDLAQRIWLGVDRTTEATLRTSLAAFQHQQTESTDEPCHFSGADGSGNPFLATWLTNTFAGTGAHVLPGSAADMVSVAIGDALEFNRVTITVCWQPNAELPPRRHILQTWVN